MWLFEAIEEWRNADRGSRLFWIMGAPGVGKSTFAAHLAHHGRDKVIAVEFCDWKEPVHQDARRIVRTLAFQIATRLPDYRRLLLTLPEIAELDRKNPAELFDYLLADPFRHAIDGGRERYLIVIDALDEAGGSGRNELVEILARNAPRLPDWLGIVVTSRPESEVLAPLRGLNPFVLDTATESNRADIRDYLNRELASHLQGRPDADSLVEQILEKSEGVFLYVERFCDDVQRGYLSLDRPEQFPQGLGGIFFQYFQRQFPDLEQFRKDVRPALRAILAAREPLPIEILQRLFDWEDEELRDFTRPLGSLFPLAIEAGHEVIKPYHKSLADWVADEAKASMYFVSVMEGHRLLADECWREYERGTQFMSGYAVRYVAAHLAPTEDWPRLERILTDSRYLIVALATAEQTHGNVLVSRTLGYLAASRSGLTEEEILDLLSNDKEVVDEFHHRKPESDSAQHLVVSVWPHLHYHLEPFLSQDSYADAALIRFRYPEIGDAVAKRYLPEETLLRIHRVMADYFRKRAELDSARRPEIIHADIQARDWFNLSKDLE